MLEIFPVEISSFKQERLIRVYLPKEYIKENKKYPVLYMNDGQNVFRDKDAIGGTSLNLEKYLNEHDLNVIVVGIVDRITEICFPRLSYFVNNLHEF